jgi:Flp pilus assembly protein TadD
MVLFLLLGCATAPEFDSAPIACLQQTAKRASLVGITALPPRENRFALLIGVSTYKDPGIPPLTAPSNDVDQLADALVKSGVFPKEHLFILSTDRPEQSQPEAGIILQTVDKLARAAGRNGLFLLAYSGHGYEVEGKAFLLGCDARIMPEVKWLQRTCVAWSDINEIINEVNVGQVILLLDACRSEPNSRGLGRANQPTQIYERGVFVRQKPTDQRAVLKMLATQNGEPAYEDGIKNLGVFMSSVIDGLKGRAADAEGVITIARLRRFIEQEVPLRARFMGRQQQPVAEIEGYDQEQVVIAKVLLGQPDSGERDKEDVQAKNRTENPIISELNDWIKVRKTESVAELKRFLRLYPNGNFAGEASSRILDLEEEARTNEKASSAEQAQAALTLSDDLLYVRKGDQLLGLGRPDKAADEYRQAIKLNPGRAVYYGKLGIALYVQGKFKDAATEYKKAIQMESFSATFLFNFGLALYRQQKFADAETKFRRAVKLNPIDASFHAGLGLSLAFQKASAEAAVEFREAIKLDPNSASYHGNLANVLMQLRRYREAESEYQRALDLDPANLNYKESIMQVRRLYQ